jgi:hypothetical protein
VIVPQTIILSNKSEERVGIVIIKMREVNRTKFRKCEWLLLWNCSRVFPWYGIVKKKIKYNPFVKNIMMITGISDRLNISMDTPDKNSEKNGIVGGSPIDIMVIVRCMYINGEFEYPAPLIMIVLREWAQM